VVIIDQVETKLNDLSSDFSGFKINGDATRMAVLEEAKLKDADVLIATSHEDNVNLMVAQIALKIYNIPQVMARVFDPQREEVYALLGIETICPTSVAADMFLRDLAEGEKRHEAAP